MKCTKLIALMVLGVLWMPAAYAGFKGFTAVFVNVGGSRFYESAGYLAFTNGFPDSQKQIDFWESRATGGESFEWIIKKNLPEGLTQEMATAIYDGNVGATKKAQSILAKARTPEDK